MAFWRRLLAGSDWSHLMGVLSPSLFDVVSPFDLSKRAAELARNWFDRAAYIDCVRRSEACTRAIDIGLDVREAKPSRSRIPFRAEPLSEQPIVHCDDGAALLRYFFLQIASTDTVFLDLRAKRFCLCPETGRIEFVPVPLWARWQPDFVQGIRELYRGFYVGPSSLFESATRALGVAAANSVFEQAFGGPRKRANRHKLSEFRDTFQEVFIKCRDAKTAFHPDFVTLGIMLATLYDHLETIGGTENAEDAYASVHRLLGH